MFFRRERDMIVPGLVGGAVGALAAGYIVSRDGRKIPVDKNGNPVQGQAQGQSQAQGGEQQAANQNQQQQAQANQKGQQQQAPAANGQGAAGGNTQAEKPQAQATTQQPASTQNNATTQKPPVQNTPPPAQAPATPPPAQTPPPPAQNTQPKPTTTTQPAGNTTTTSQTTTTPPKPTTTTTSTGGNTTQTTQKPASNTTQTQTQTKAPATTPNTTQPKTKPQTNNTQGQFKRPENFNRADARQAKWQANRDRKDAGIARRNALQKQQATTSTTAATQPKPAGNTGGFVRNTAGDTDTRRLNAMYRGPIVKQKAPQQPGKISPNGLRYTPNGGAPQAAQTVTNNAAQTAANAAKKTGQHIRDRRPADPLKDSIIRHKANIQKDLRESRLRTEAYKSNASSALGRAGDRTATFFKRRGQDIKTGANAVGAGFKRAAGTFKRGGAVNGFLRKTGTAIKNVPARAGSAYLGGVSKVLGGMSRGLGRASARSRVASGILKSAIKK